MTVRPSTRPQARAGRLLLALLGVVLVVGGLLVVVSADDDVVRERVVVDGVPVTMLRPAGDGPFPGVVVAHGFSASSTLMSGIGIALAEDGWAAALLDFRGHGASARGLGDTDAGGLEDDLAAVRGWLRERPDVAGEPALVGHSMGAGAVTRVATDDPAVPGTVAISLPTAEDLPPAAEGPPLFLLVGSAEPARFGEAAQQAADLGYQTETIPGAEHISILFRTATLESLVGWLDETVGREPAGPVGTDWRLPAVGAVYLGSALVFWPVSAWVLRPAPSELRGRGRQPPAWLATPLAGVAAGLVLLALPGLAEAVPLLIGGYLAAFLVLTGVVLLLWAGRWERPEARALAGGLLLGLYAAVALAVPAQLAWAQVALTGLRGWVALALVLAALVFGWGELLVARREHVGYGAVLLGRVLLGGVLVGLGVTGAAPGFLLLLAPLIAVVLPWFGAYGVRVARLTGSPAAGALTQALPLGLLVAIATPLA